MILVISFAKSFIFCICIYFYIGSHLFLVIVAMAGRGDSLGIPEESEKKEYFDDEETLSLKLDKLADWVKSSQHVIIFTGAGISTSTGIPDFRSGMNTVLTTGPGVWEVKDKGLVGKSRKEKTKSVLKAIPSISHMGIVRLHQNGMIKLLISQNTDGLHLRSGINPSALCELHGNTNLEVCVKCGAKYLRDFRTRNARKVHDHYTGRLCDETSCRGRLKDSIINFGEDLPEEDLSKAYLHAEDADLCIVMGSSLRVSPANEIPRIVAKKKGRLVICNLQKTPLDSKASLSIHSFCDDMMYGLMLRLDLPIPKWELVRRAKLEVRVTKRKDGSLLLKASIFGLHPDKDTPYSIFEKVIFGVDVDGEKRQREIQKEPFRISQPMNEKMETPSNSIKISCKLVFHGHFGEPAIDLNEKFEKEAALLTKEYMFFYDPAERKWRMN